MMRSRNCCAHSRLWLRLIAGTAMIGGVVTVADAQVLPGPGSVMGTPVVSSGGAAPVISNPTATALQVNLNAAGTLINWNGFNVPVANTATFHDSRGGPAMPAVVLNRDVNTLGQQSIINGTLKSDPNVSVFVINGNGILFGPSAVVNVGGLVASSIDLTGSAGATDANFLVPASGHYNFQSPATANGVVTVAAGARMSANGSVAPGSIVLIGAEVSASGALSANGDVGIVAATDVTISLGSGGPLSMMINQGTSLAAPIVARGTIGGRNVVFAAATQSTVMNALLDIGAVTTATTATATDYGVVLSAGPAAAGSVVAYGAGDNTGALSAALSSATATGTEGGIRVGAAGDIQAGTLTAATGVMINAGSLNAVNIKASAGDILLTTAGGPLQLGAAQTGTPTTFASLTLVSAGVASVTGAVAITGDYQIIAPSIALGGALPTNQAAGGAVVIKSIAGGISGAAGLTLLFDSTGAGGRSLILDATGGGIDFASTSLLQGGPARQSTVGIRLGTPGTALTLGGVQALQLSTVDAGHALFTPLINDAAITFGGPVTVTNALSVTSTGSSVTTADVTVKGSGQSLTLKATTDVTTNGTLSAPGAVVVTASGNAAIGGVVSGTDPLALDRSATVTAGTVSVGSVDVGSNLGLTAQTGALTLGGGVVGGAATLTKLGSVGGLTLSGALDTASATLNSSTDATISSVSSRSGNVDISATRAASVTDAIAAGGAYSVTGGTVVLGNGGTVDQHAGGAVTITAKLGTITGRDGLTLRSDNTGAGGRSLILDATGGGIDFASTSPLQGGPARQSTVGIRLGTPGTALTLGGVQALQLSTVDAGHALFTPLINDAAITFRGPVTVTNALSVTSTGSSVTTADVTVKGSGQSLTLKAATDVTTNGTLSAPGAVVVTASGNAAIGGVVSETDNVVITATRAASVTDAVAAGGTYSVTGGTVVLGNGSTVDQHAGGTVVIKSIAGGISGAAGLTLLSDSTGAGGRSLILDATGGGIDFASTSLLQGGPARQSTVGIRLGTPGSALTLGAVQALQLSTVDAAHALFTPLINDAAITFGGPVTVTNSLAVSSTGAGITTAAVTVTGSGQSLMLDAHGDLLGTGLLTSPRTLTLNAGGNLRLLAAAATGALTATAGGDITGLAAASPGNADPAFGRADLTSIGGTVLIPGSGPTTPGLVQLGAVAGAGGINIAARQLDVITATASGGGILTTSAQATAVTTATAATDIVMTAGNNATPGNDGQINVINATAGGALRLAAYGNVVGSGITLGSGSSGAAATLTTTGGQGDIRLTSLTAGTAVGSTAGATVTAVGNVRLDSVAAPGSVAVTAGGDITGLAMAVPTNPDPAFGRGSLTSTAGSVAVSAPGLVQLGALAGAAGVTITASQIDLTSADAQAGSIGTTTTFGTAINTVTAFADIVMTAGNSAVPGSDGQIAITTANAGGALQLSSYGHSAVVGITLGSGTAGGAATLTATGAPGDFRSGSAISFGNLRLGTVTAAGTVQVTAGDDITGLAAELSANPAPAFGRAALTSSASTISVLANGVPVTTGLVQLGAIAGRTGVMITGRQLDVTSAASAMGGITLTARELAPANLVSLTLGSAVAQGDINLTANAGSGPPPAAANGSLTAGTLTAGTALTTMSAGASTLGELMAGGGVTLRSGGALGFGPVTSGGTLSFDAAGLVSGGAITAGGPVGGTGSALQLASVKAGTTLDLTSTAGGIAATTLSAAGDTTLAATGGGITLASVASSAGGVSATTTGAFASGGVAAAVAARVSAASIGIDSATTGTTLTLTAKSGAARLGTATSGGAATINAAGNVALTGALTVGDNLTVSGAAIDLAATGTAVQAARGAVSMTASSGPITGGGGLTLVSGSSASGQPLTLTALGSSGAVTFAPGSTISGGTAGAGADVTIAATGILALNNVTAAGHTATVTAADLTLSGPVSAAQITLTDSGTAGVRLGDTPAANTAEFAAAAAGHFDLTSAEITRLSAQTVVIDARAQNVVTGDLPVGARTGSATFGVRTLGRFDVLGRIEVMGSTAARLVSLGGDGSASGQATVIRIATTPAAGGRLIADGATLALYGNRIGAGYDANLLAPLALLPAATSPVSAADASSRFVSQPNSALYVATLGNQPAYTDTVVIRAGSLNTSYGQFAVFQNTGLPGFTSGAVIGSATSTTATLRLPATAAATPNAFAIFGTVNGFGGTTTALLGPRGITVGALTTRISSRANGCLIGSAGGGCLAASLTQPQLVLFESHAEVFRISDSLTVSFDPLVGTSNEALFSDIAGVELPANEPACPIGDPRACVDRKEPR